jgi:hypothetical protein
MTKDAREVFLEDQFQAAIADTPKVADQIAKEINPDAEPEMIPNDDIEAYTQKFFDSKIAELFKVFFTPKEENEDFDGAMICSHLDNPQPVFLFGGRPDHASCKECLIGLMSTYHEDYNHKCHLCDNKVKSDDNVMMFSIGPYIVFVETCSECNAQQKEVFDA